MMKSILIADSIYLSRKGIKTLLQNFGFDEIREITKLDQLWMNLETITSEILIVNLCSDILTVEKLCFIKEAFPKLSLLGITNEKEKTQLLKIVKNCNSCLTEKCGEKEIKQALEAVSIDERFICSNILETILENTREEKMSGVSLTPRETEIVTLIAEGNSNQEISEKLFLSIHTVYTHRKNIMKKLRLKSPVELVLYALENGIILK